MAIYLGTQGWSYKSWNGVFYPPNTPPGSYLAEYAKRLSAVEIDSTYYATPRPSTVEQWDRVTPPDFRFTAKFPQAITHDKMLEDVSNEVEYFLSGMSELGDKLGPLLLQFPYNFKPDRRTLLDEFLATLPPNFRYAVEVRQRGWLQDWFFELLQRHRVALVLADYSFMPKLKIATTDLAYVRLLGNRKDVPDDEYDHVRLNRDRELDEWAEVIEDLARRDIAIWVFANNHYQGHSPATVESLRGRLSSRGLLP